MTTTTANIYELAEKLNAKVWEKGDMKRIYLNDEGYNTKKMSMSEYLKKITKEELYERL